MAFNFFKTDVIPEDQIVYVYDLVRNIVAPGDRAFMSPRMQEVIDRVLDKRLPQGWREDKGFIKQLSSDFSRHSFGTYDKKYFAEFYAAYYVPNNLYKIQLMLLELFRLGRISFSEREIRILDIGSATGTSAMAIYDFYDILFNVLKLYGLSPEKLSRVVVDSVEKSAKNIEVFKDIMSELNIKGSRIKINDPIHSDCREWVKTSSVKSYDIIIASNILNELPSHISRRDLIDNLINGMKKDSHLVLLETAYLSDTIALKKLQLEFGQRKDITVLSPCGKLRGFSGRCDSCYSFRRESLNIPDTMRIFAYKQDDSFENEKLKWSYTIFAKSKEKQTQNFTPTTLLDVLNSQPVEQIECLEVEIVSGRIDDASDKEHYYLKICDQSEDREHTILKIPAYYELPRYHFGDILQLRKAKQETISWSKPPSINKAIVIDPRVTTVTNLSEITEPRGLVKFKDFDEKTLQYFLWRFFGFKEFTEGQYEIICKVLRNENILGILATGGGKSLTFQLPALLKPGVSIVISPLKSLMDDQIYNLKERFGFDFVDRIHSGMEISEKKTVLDRFKNGRLKLLYVAPERIQQKAFQKELNALIQKGININYFPVDEAHCISEWGHDFRPAYARLRERQEDLPHLGGVFPSIIALTATASQKVQEDILAQLNMSKETDLVHRILDRKELSLEVITLNYDPLENQYSIRYRLPQSNNGNPHFETKSFPQGTQRPEILHYVLTNVLPTRFDDQNISSKAGLIFSTYADPESQVLKITYREREGARWISRYLRLRGIDNRPWFSQPGYRKDLKALEKRRLEKAWEKIKAATQNRYIRDEINLLCTTKGFGMGIDKPNIRYVIHYGFPGSMESYFQQIGRAGRDRKHSHCILLWEPYTQECEAELVAKTVDHKLTVPSCFTEHLKSAKRKYTSCKFGRIEPCDYAKQIFFVEGGYPSVPELECALKYLKDKSQTESTKPWLYLKKEYLGDAVAKALTMPISSPTLAKEESILETLYTLGYVTEFSRAYLKITITRKTTMREIRDSSNNDIIREQIELLDKVYPGFIDKPASSAPKKFDIAEYVQKLRRDHKVEITIDEVIQFFNLLAERDDFELSFNYMNDFGSEIKLNEQLLNEPVSANPKYSIVKEWKSSQYQMLNNMVDYAKLAPFDDTLTKVGEKVMCRRAHIMTTFASDVAKMDSSVRCNYCDNCGFLNPWDKKANDIVASLDEREYAKQLTDLFSEVSKNVSVLLKKQSIIVQMARQMIEHNYLTMVETKALAWLEQIGETKNPATNLFLAIIHNINGDDDAFRSRLEIALEVVQDDIGSSRTILDVLLQTVDIPVVKLYEEYFQKSDFGTYKNNLLLFNANGDDRYNEVEIAISLDLVDYQIKGLESRFRQFRKV